MHCTSAVAAQRLDGTVLWRWGTPNLGRRNWHHDVACQIHDWDGDGCPEVVVCTRGALPNPDGSVRWVYHSDHVDIGSGHLERALVPANMVGNGRADVIVTSPHAAHVFRNEAGLADHRVTDLGSEPNFTLY